MSTPSSIVGEQYSTGRAASLNSRSRSWRSSGGTWAVSLAFARSPARVAGDTLVQVAEERVDPRALLVVQGAPHPVLGAGHARARLPVDDGGAQPVAGDVVLVTGDGDREQSRLVQDLEQVGDDLLSVGGFQGELAALAAVLADARTGRTGRGPDRYSVLLRH